MSITKEEFIKNNEKAREQLSELEVSEEIMILLSKLPIKEMDELGNEDPEDAVRRTLECYGIDELIDLRDELKAKLKEQNRKKRFVIWQEFNDQEEITAKTLEEAMKKALKHYGIKIKKLKD